MWSDNDTNVDLIDFSHLVGSVKRIIDNDDLVPCTIGMYGDWGSGKSSLLNMVEKEFEGDDETLLIQFNGWLFEGYDDAKTSLMSNILEQIASNKKLSVKGKEIAKRLFKQIDWLKLAKQGVAHGITFAATGGIGNAMIEMNRLAKSATDVKSEDVLGVLGKFKDGDYDHMISNLSDATKGERTLQMGIREFHRNFSSLLEETKIKRLVVFIDDLDRCTPNTIIDTLEAIKLFLFVPNSAFVISADERLIEYAVRHRFPEIPGSNAEVGRDYLEKLVQFPIRIPQLSEVEIETYINLLFAKLHLDKELFAELRFKVFDEKSESLLEANFNQSTSESYLGVKPQASFTNDLILSSQIVPILAKGLNGNPRQCKRFLNTLLMRFEMAKSKQIEIEKRTLAKLMLLEYFRPEMFRTISKLQNSQEGKPKEFTEIETYDGENPLGDNLDGWMADDWLNKWFLSEPQLSGTDLRPYFYFSRDILRTLPSESGRMTPEAIKIYRDLISESTATKKNGIKALKNLNELDVVSIFSSVSKNIREQENDIKRGDLLKMLCEFVIAKIEMGSEFLLLLESMDETLLAPAIVPQLSKALNGTAHEKRFSELINKWSENKVNTTLAQATKM